MQSQAETVRVLGEVIQRYYGDQVNMKYIDVIDDDMEQYSGVEEYLKNAGMKLPLLTINGRIIRPGAGLNYMEIEEELEELGLRKK